MERSKPRVAYVLVGPTAVGKTAVSIVLAREMNAEIISADSRQIYRGMDIGTAKPGREDRELIPHHFIDIKNPDEEYNAGRYGAEARIALEDIWARGKEAIVVGGSGLYLRSLIDGFFDQEGAEAVDRRRMRGKRNQHASSLHDRLKEIDPETAGRLHPHDAKRIERAIEVFERTGRRLSDLHRDRKDAPAFDARQVGLHCDRAQLYRRIEERVEAMMLSGMVDETRRLLERGYDEHVPAMESLGYRDIVRHVRGTLSFEEMMAHFKQESRRYAKRQLTWFRKDRRIRWVDTTDAGVPEIAGQVRALWMKGMEPGGGNG